MMTLKEDMVGTDRGNGKHGRLMIHGHFKVGKSWRDGGGVMMMMTLYLTICRGGGSEEICRRQNSGRAL